MITIQTEASYYILDTKRITMVSYNSKSNRMHIRYSTRSTETTLSIECNEDGFLRFRNCLDSELNKTEKTTKKNSKSVPCKVTP